eukprot:6352262-Karenia_brevis.AAC.1
MGTTMTNAQVTRAKAELNLPTAKWRASRSELQQQPRSMRADAQLVPRVVVFSTGDAMLPVFMKEVESVRSSIRGLQYCCDHIAFMVQMNV